MATTVVRGCEIEYDQFGDGPDVVWGHGLTSSMASEDELGWIDWNRIATDHRVLRYDARGHGRSDSTPEPSDYSWENLARDQLALADALGVDRYVAGGASMGCATALHAAVLAPERIAGLVLVIPPTAWSTRAAQTGTYAVMADLVEAREHEILLAGAAENPPPDPLVGNDVWAERFATLLERTDPVRLARVFRGAGTADLPAPEQIRAIEQPALILAWTGDTGHPVQTAARLQELIPTTELVLAATADAMSTWTERIAAFVRDCG